MKDSNPQEQSFSPPYGSVAAFAKFFDLLERRTIDKVTTDSVREDNLTSEGNEYKLIRGLRFLDLIDENGNATEKLRSLHFVGEEFIENLEKIIRRAYGKLFSEVDLEGASHEDLVNALMKSYGIKRGSAREAVRILIYLVQKAKMPISDELTSGREVGGRDETDTTRRKEGLETLLQPVETKPLRKIFKDGMQTIIWGEDILIQLKEGDRPFKEKVALKAKELIDLYVRGNHR